MVSPLLFWLWLWETMVEILPGYSSSPYARYRGNHFLHFFDIQFDFNDRGDLFLILFGLCVHNLFLVDLIVGFVWAGLALRSIAAATRLERSALLLSLTKGKSRRENYHPRADFF
jgi:hypothetical protein